nr:biotin-dependent carboxyltransferase family protein [Jannaschia sp. Os4]
MTTVQDRGRPGHLARGLAAGGAADLRALDEAEALVGPGAVIESAPAPLTVRLHAGMRVAVLGAPAAVTVEGRALAMEAAHDLPDGAEVQVRPTGRGAWTYLAVAGGIAAPEVMGGRGAHLIAGIGRALNAGDRLEVGTAAPRPAARLAEGAAGRLGGGELRLLPGPQTGLFPREARARLEATPFVRDARGNRQGIKLSGGDGFATEGQLTLLSDFVRAGDVQMTGAGEPYVLGPECQTTGGYPRIGTVIPADLPRAMQAAPGAPLRLRFVTRAEALAATPPPPRTEPLVRDPRDMPDLLGYQLIDGVWGEP